MKDPISDFLALLEQHGGEKMVEALSQVVRSREFLIRNGIEPTSRHKPLAKMWAEGTLSDEGFLLFARLVSQKGEGDESEVPPLPKADR